MAKSTVLELVSVLGVGVIGFGLGALFAVSIGQYAYQIILAGILVHGIAMYNIHSGNKEERPWVKLLYWLCWAILAGLAVYIVVGLLR